MADDFLTLVCPSCGGKNALSNDVDRFVCEYCGNQHVFRLPTRQEPQLVARPQEPSRPRLAPRPEGVTITKEAGVVQITWRWFSLKYLGMLFFVIVWNGFLCFWYSMAFASKGPWIMFVFPLIHLSVGVYLAYSTLAGFLNRTTLLIDRQNFRVQHDPVPWPGEINVPVTELDQLYCTEKRHRSKNSVSYTYQLVAMLRDGRKKNLVSNLDSPDIAHFLEQQIENLLNITDRPVAGELE